MDKLKHTIEQQGIVLNNEVLKVDRFLNHTIDVELMEEMGQEFARHFKNAGITKVLTVETGGIAPGYAAAKALGVNLIFAKKTEPNTMQEPISAKVFSFTKQKEYTICLEKNYIQPEDRILFIDDFLANGEAFKGVEQLIAQTGASIAGVGICIEKAFQKGHAYIIEQGYDLYPLASVDHIENKKIYWAC